MTSLEFLKAIYNDPELPLTTRMRAATSCLPYEYPRLSMTAVVTADESFVKRLELCYQRSAMVRIEQPQLVSDLRMPPTKLRRI
jgi:hypothetical protein